MEVPHKVLHKEIFRSFSSQVYKGYEVYNVIFLFMSNLHKTLPWVLLLWKIRREKPKASLQESFPKSSW